MVQHALAATLSRALDDALHPSAYAWRRGRSAHDALAVIDRAMAAPGAPVSLDDLKIIILMVYWSFGQEPDPLVLDELCDDSTDRIAH